MIFVARANQIAAATMWKTGWFLLIFCVIVGRGPGARAYKRSFGDPSVISTAYTSASASASTSSQMQSRAVDTRVELEVLEGQPKGTRVGYIPTKPGFTYRFNEPPRQFVLDPNTGEIKTNVVLDREGMQNDRYDLVVLSSQPTYPIEVRITVIDINDNPPEFPESSIAISFSESAAPGTRLLLDAATDKDLGINGVSDDYQIIDGNKDEKFRLIVTPNPTGEASYLHIETTGKLDRETQGLYILNISARDGGTPPKFGYLQVNVTILDVNDNPPIFDHSDYSVSLNESVPPGTPVLQVMATDSDLGDNSRITYYLADTERQFTVDPDTGWISTTELLECPQQNCPQNVAKPGIGCPKSCVFTVFARDHGTPRQDGRTYVTVNLLDANDHDPVIRFRYFPSTAAFATVDENAQNGSVVAAVSVVDVDEGLNGETSVQIVSGNELNHFRLDYTQNFDIVRVNGVLDREEISKYNLTVVATDKGTPPRTATAFLIIHVNDVNDHEPVFEKSEYSTILSELAPPGSYVASITATDEDTGVNAQIYYSFVSGNDHQWFLMDANSGLITTRTQLDREVQGTVELRISAKDGGPNPKWAYTQLKITILDENDEAPQFSKPTINVSLSENTPPNMLIATLNAADHDQGTNGSVTYLLQSDVNQRYPDTFMLDSLTGQLMSKIQLDRETIAHYEIQVIARDQGAPPQSSTATVFLNVLDINDNSPEFYPQRYFVTIKDDAVAGTSVLKVTAFDLDEGDNALITYSLESGSEGLFVVNELTGVITLRGNLTNAPNPIYKLRISATDHGDRRAVEDAFVEIIKESFMEKLEFENAGGYDFRIEEDDDKSATPNIGRVVDSVHVRNFLGGSVSYIIIYGDQKHNFKINEQTGEITTANKIDREQNIMYSLTVIARSGLAFGKTVVNISVQDLNDNPPVFPRDRDEVHLPENAAVGQEVFFARARDRDAGVNSRLTYSLTYNPDEQFRVSESTGVIYLNRPVRVESGTVMNIDVTATDSGDPPLSSKHTIMVLVEDVNDHTPVFDHTSYETSLLESTPVNTRFFILGASDADLGENGRISFSIIEGNAEEKFSIFPDGYLYVKSPLDREEKDYYALTVMAQDHGNPVRSSVVPVVIHVIDENDNAPEFINTTFTFSIRENEPIDSFVGKLLATDRDIGRNAELIFSLPSTQTDFAVDHRNGFIKTLRVFDREELVRTTGQSYITLEAFVSDNGKPRLKDKVKVHVHITDINDNPPTFLRTPYKVQISEGTTVGSQFIRMYTTDSDEGLNGDVFYSLAEGNEDERFSIDEATGQITVARPLDRETVSKYQLTVVAHDAGLTTRLSSSTVVTVTILDENDNAPEFTQTDTKISILETTPINTELIQFRASDSDLGINSEIMFAIGSGNRRDTFHIDPDTGKLYLHKPLDYEDLSSYQLNITAFDGGNPRLSTTILFSVQVQDANDNPPSFPSTAIVRQIREGIPLHTPIVTIVAEDPDSGINGKVAYSIAHQEPLDGKRHFYINNTTGVIHTLLPIDRESIDTFRLTVVATDQAQPENTRLSAEKLVTVIVEDVNDNAPIFVSMNAALLPSKKNQMMHLNRGESTFIMNVLARDLDSSTNGLVTYELVSGNMELFRLHRTTGVLSLRKSIEKFEPRYQLAVKATDEAVQSERRSTEAYITLIATGGHTRGPMFESDVISGSVYENEPPGTSIVTVTARLNDRDSGANDHHQVDIEYYVTNVTGGGKQVDRLFDIDTKLGVLSTADMLDREAGVDVYEVEVVAIVIGGTPRTSTIKIKITVLDKNDSPPSFKDTPLIYSVSEDLGIGQPVTTLRAIDPDTIGQLRYTLEGGDEHHHFALDPHSGVLQLKDTLDRETQDVYKLLVRVSDMVQHTDTTVTIVVTDTNDNPPVFSESAYSFDIPEDSVRGARVGQITATDPDQGVNSQLIYTVISDWANDVFSLNSQTGVFTLTARLDYEEVQHYILVVQAQDSGTPSLSSTLTVYCNVVDLNDNAPIFDPMSYSNEIYENVTIGTSVVTVSATDSDSGDNGKIVYSITSGDEKNDFEILSNGTIRTRHQLDRETHAVYNLVVTATDQAKPPEKQLSSTVQVTIILKDINDMAPEFVSSKSTSVSENISPNTVVIAVKAVDKDEGRNGYIEYSLANDDDANGVFSLGPVDGFLRVSGRLDRELRSNYSLFVVAKDRGDPPLSTNTTIFVQVLDENDNSPVFDPKQYSASIAENASIGASVLQVSATDIDEGLNGRVRFSISSGDTNRDFSIAEDSGVVRVAKNLNYERKSRYVLTVRAEDCAGDITGGEVRSDVAELTISVSDINDNPPTFLDSPYIAYVMENIIPPNGGYVITVEAYDADSPPFNSLVRYFIKEGDTDIFRINASTGEISLLRALDREVQEEYVLSLVAMDTGSPPLTGTGMVRIIIQDVNDHSPEFEWHSYKATIKENLPKGTWIITPKATDRDTGLNAKIRYSLLGEKVERFHVDQNKGIVTTATELDREETDVYYLTLMAQDCSTTEPRVTTVNLTIVVLDENDNPPVFSSPVYVVSIPDRTQAGQFVFGAKATDADIAENSKLIYSLSGPDVNKFTINKETGVIRATEELSLGGLGRGKIFEIQIKASDSGAEQKSATAELKIHLKTAHLFPSFTTPVEHFLTLPEDIYEGKVIAKISATSPKKAPTGIIRYAIAGGNVGDAISIDSVSGEVLVSGRGLDYETSPQYEVWIEARDSDNPPLRSVQQMIINVTDANDNPPVMEYSIYNATVMEEEVPPVFVIKITATDADTNENGQIRYEIVNDFEGTFEMDAESGEIYTSMRLDREEISNYDLVVHAIDQGTPQLTGTATVLVSVLDKNDNPPRFTRLFSVNVTENAEIGSFVIRVTSSDQDIGENANATYSFTENPGKKFAIDPISGNVTVIGSLDREQQDEYLLKVAAVDGSWRAETPLTITIQDQNDNTPEFEHSYYSFNFPEMQPSMAFVGQVSATDRDKQGPNSVISYSLQQPSDLFTIDPATGDIFSKRTLQYKYSQMEFSPENTYTLTVLATDNGKPPMSSECLVTINIVDANNNQPHFEQKEYLAPVPVESKIGQRIIKVVAKDELDFGVNAEIDYKQFGGNASDYFTIDRNTGWISIVKQLTQVGLTYVMKVRATDRGVPPQHDDATVVIVVTGENKYRPIFTALSYQVIVPENEPLGSTIVTVSASDADEGPNGMVRYRISGGNERKEFGVDALTGAVTILQPLDYDTVPEYKLNITAEDLGFDSRHTTAMLTVTLTDINDNAPTFNQSSYEVYLAENSPPKTFVTRLIATDIDSPKNAIIEYSIVGGSGKDLFMIEPKTGIITSRISFDFEERNLYDLDILAANPDSVMYGSTKVIVHITGVNEYYPRFIQSVFHFDVSESAVVGTNVGVIQATDQDAGDDGKVYYLFVGSSNDKGFTIGPETGIIKISRSLDRETQNRVVLTVMAKNAGGIRGNDTDEAQVIISIQDGNDPPEFLQSFYKASVSEGASYGTRVVTVKAIDKDVRPQNNQFSYSIIGGNIDQVFKIDPQTGDIETSRELDREKIPVYNLIIGAIDSGIPPQTGSTTVQITLTDINDNGPIFDPPNVIGYVMENQPPFTKVMTLTATDPDLPPNGAPFSYYLVGGRHKDMVVIEKHTGVVKTTKSLDRESTPTLDIEVEVEDSGTPRMRSKHHVQIVVLDENDSPSTSRSVHVIVYAFSNSIPIGKIADVHPNDADTTGEYQCKILQAPVPNAPLSIPNACDLYTTQITPNQGYSLSVSGNDGKHSDVVSKVTVEFLNFDNMTIDNSVTVRITNMTATYFLTNFYNGLLDLWKTAFETRDNIKLVSIYENATNLDLTVAVEHLGKYRNKANIIEQLSKKKNQMKNMFKNSQITIGYTPCQIDTCENDGICTEAIKVHSDTRITDSPALIFTSPLVIHEFSCHCSDGFTGQYCSKRQDPCSPNPCKAGGQCRRQGFDFQCICPLSREGRYCEQERGDACSENPCRNGGSCRESPDGSSFFCLCRPGYRGNHCEAIADSCRPNPCLYGGLCISLKPGYNCSCIDGRYGRHCEKGTYGFNELSYMKFPALDAATNDISLIFSTTKPNALLIYNYGAQSGGRSDFVAMELVDGKAKFSFGGARTAITSVSVAGKTGTLSDGTWHKITATRNGRVVSLSVSMCTEHGDTCEDCRPGDTTCYADEIGPTGTLNFNNQPLLVGGLASADPVLERPGQIHSDDLVGCVHSISVNGRTLNLSNPIESNGVQSTCTRQGNCKSSTSDPCGNSGICLDHWQKLTCKCDNRIIAPNCHSALQPVHLSDGGFIEYEISQKHRRMQLLENIYKGSTVWYRRNERLNSSEIPAKTMSLMFRTVKQDGLLIYAASNKHYTAIELRSGELVYISRLSSSVNMSSVDLHVTDGKWHNLTLHSINRELHVFLDGVRVGDELDTAGVHDFLDPYLTTLTLGGLKADASLNIDDAISQNFEGCLANFTINNEIQPFNGSGTVFYEVITRGKITSGCSNILGVGAAVTPDPLSIGITLVIVFFVVLLVAILVSFIVFRLRRQKKEKSGAPGCSSGMHGKQNGGNAIMSSSNLVSLGPDGVLVRPSHTNETSVAYLENGDVIRGVSGHHIIAPELISKKYKDREMPSNEHRPQRPDIIEREVVGKSPPMREDHHPPMPPSSAHVHDHPNTDLNSELPEHYDLENASSIAPSDIDIVYHYKGYREAGGVRKYKATPPPVATYHHKHSASQNQAQHRHSPHHAQHSGYPPRAPPTTQAQTNRQHQSTPLARLSPSSELSAQQPRILTLHDISGKPLQTALLATTSSSGGVGKDPLHSNSERSLNSPVMSQLSGQSSASRKAVPQPPNGGNTGMGLTAEEIERLNSRPRTSSLVSTLDAVSSSSEAPHGPHQSHLAHLHHSPVVDTRRSSTTTDESGNDSFTCSEIEYDNSSLAGDKYKNEGESRCTDNGSTGSKPIPPPSYDGFDSSFRGSLSTLVASDDDLNGPMYRPPAGSPSTTSALGWDYLLNWGPDFESLVGVFKDIAELPDGVNNRVPTSLRLPSAPKPSEEYV